VSESEGLDSLLGLLQEEGQFHSRGQFTLDPGRNRDKMATLLQQDPLSWVYWFIRCGVTLKATRCEILVGRNALVARLELVSGGELLENFLEGAEDPEANLPLRYLRSALLWSQAWLGLQADFAANLLLERPGQPHLALHVESTRVTRQSEERPGQTAGLTLALVPGSQRSHQELFFALRRLLRENLPARVAFCPMPVYLDGQRLDGSLVGDTSLPLYTRYYLGPTRSDCLAVQSPVAAHYYRLESSPPQVWPRPRFCLPQARVHTFSLAGELPAAVQWSLAEGLPVSQWSTELETTRLFANPLQVAQTEDRWLVRAALQRQGSDNDHWAVVQHGVRLNLEPLPLGKASRWGWLAVVGLDGAQTDLSGMRLVQDSLYEDLRGWLREEIVEIHDQQVALT